MAVVKVIELLAQSPNSWEEATQVAVREAANSVRNIKSVYVKELEAVTENDRITAYRVNVKISFLVEGTGG